MQDSVGDALEVAVVEANQLIEAVRIRLALTARPTAKTARPATAGAGCRHL